MAEKSDKLDVTSLENSICDVFDLSKNLYNPNDVTNHKGIMLDLKDGSEISTSSTVNSITTDYYKTQKDDNWVFYTYNEYETTSDRLEVRVHWYDSDKKYIKGSIVSGFANAPANAAYLRFTESFTISNPNAKMMVTKNTENVNEAYAPNRKLLTIKRQALPNNAFPTMSKRYYLMSNTREVLETNSIMTNKVYTFSAVIGTSFSSFTMGHGNSYIELDGTSLTIYNSYPPRHTTLQHGLQITNTLQIKIDCGINGKATITITSNGYDYETTQTWEGNEGDIFIMSGNSTFSPYSVSWYCKNYKSEIWAYGDDYFNLTDHGSWIYQLFGNGHGKNILIDGLKGRKSSQAIESLKNSLKHGLPTYILWCIGPMIEQDMGGSSGAVNRDWLSSFKEVKDICLQNNITLIGCTIPNTPSCIHKYKNDIIKKSKIRYIDFASAVSGSIYNNTWYNGMLSNDGETPTEKGAITMYRQAITDFPELMN